VLSPFHTEQKKLPEQRFIANLRETRTYVAGKLMDKQLEELVRLAKPVDTVGEDPEPVIQYRNISTVKAPFHKKELRNAEEVEQYVEALKKRLIELINDNKRISL